MKSFGNLFLGAAVGNSLIILFSYHEIMAMPIALLSLGLLFHYSKKEQ